LWGERFIKFLDKISLVAEGRRAGIYVRVSQDPDCRRLAERLGWQVIDIYDDNDVSAFNRRKPRKHWIRLQDHIARGGLAQLSVGAEREAVELTEVDLADSSRVSPVPGCGARDVAGGLAARQLLYCCSGIQVDEQAQHRALPLDQPLKEGGSPMV
jgi:hypothetical protein